MNLDWLIPVILNAYTANRERMSKFFVRKHMAMVDQKDTYMAPVGEGNLEWDDIIEAARAGGCQWNSVEQDRCWNDRDPFDCLRSSFEFLTAKGLRAAVTLSRRAGLGLPCSDPGP